MGILFETPTAEQRAELWKAALPDRTPLADDVSFDELGRRFGVNADGITSAVFRAAAAAALRQGTARHVCMSDLINAGEIEARTAEAAGSRSAFTCPLASTC